MPRDKTPGVSASALAAFLNLRRLGLSDPVSWIRRVLNVSLYSRQRDVVAALLNHDRVAVRSGHGVGKGVVSACIAVWWAVVRNGLVLVTAPTWAQLESVWFATLRRILASASLRPSVTPALSPRLSHWLFGPLWGILGLASDRPENVQGYHAERVLLIADEAAGIGDDFFEAFEGAQVSRGVGEAKMLLLGNPTLSSGYFASAFAPASPWHKIAISCTDSPNVTGEALIPGLATPHWIDERAREWGRDSSAFRVRVLGEFPASDAGDRVFPEAVLRQALARTAPLNPPLCSVQGLDVARFGNDSSVSVIISSGRVVDVSRVRNCGAVEVARWAHELAASFNVDAVYADETGLGGGVVDSLRSLGSGVRGVNFASRTSRPERYHDIRTEMAFRLRDALASGRLALSVHSPGELLDDLRAFRYRISTSGSVALEPKVETASRLRRSPDWGDALLVAWHGVEKTDPASAPDASFGLRSALEKAGLPLNGGPF